MKMTLGVVPSMLSKDSVKEHAAKRALAAKRKTEINDNEENGGGERGSQNKKPKTGIPKHLKL